MKFGPDTLLEAQLEELLAEPVEAAIQRARTAFDREVASVKNQFVLFGAGNMGRRVLARLRQDGIEPLAFSDNQISLWGTTLDGVPVLPPQEAVTRYGRDAAFIVTIYNHRHSFPDTRDQLVKQGCNCVVSVIAFRWKYCETFLPYYRDDLPHKVLLQRDPIRQAFDLWFDAPSRREFVAQVAWRLHANFDVLSVPETGQEYFPRELFQFTPDEVFVDVGAYDGDTIQKFLRIQGGTFHRIVALEPDPGNYRKLVDYLSRLPRELASKIEARALAAADRACRLRFIDGEGTSSALNERGSLEVDCVRLDDLLISSRPTYIKMDIEGAELGAIEGCRRILSEDRPVLAACVYHAQDHLWKIPIAVSRMSPEYCFFLRPYMPECWETVCYGVPAGRMLQA